MFVKMIFWPFGSSYSAGSVLVEISLHDKLLQRLITIIKRIDISDLFESSKNYRVSGQPDIMYLQGLHNNGIQCLQPHPSVIN